MSAKDMTIILRRRGRFNKKFSADCDYYYLVKSEMEITKSGSPHMAIYVVRFDPDREVSDITPILKTSYKSLESFLDFWQVVD